MAEFSAESIRQISRLATNSLRIGTGNLIGVSGKFRDKTGNSGKRPGVARVSVRGLHACLRLSGCDLLSTVDSVKEAGDRAKNDGREALGTGIVLAGAFGRLAA